jgi:predicted TIM-barrel fold metal-dependent hydrolase
VCASGLGAALQRREFIKFFGATAARSLGTFTFGSALRPLGSVAAPATTPLRTDVHCHLFNGYDLPVYGLLVSVFLEQNIFGALAIPIALWLAASVEGNSPSYDDEINSAAHLIEAPTAAAESRPNSDQVAGFLESGMKKFIRDYTSLGQPKTSSTDRNDALLLELLRRFAPSALKDSMTKENLIELFNNPQFQKELMKRILDYKNQKNDLGFFDEISEYISQFANWVGTATSYHTQLADDLSGKFGENAPDELRLMTPAIVDFGPWPTPDWDVYRDQTRTADQQAVLLEKIALIRRPGRAIHGFIGFDPWRYLQDQNKPNNPFQVMRDAIEQRGFVGVKLYPPMGFRPYGNNDKMDFPPDLVTLCKGHPGRALDEALWKVYDYCNRYEVPIMAHCADSIGSRPNYALRSSPDYWELVLKKFKKLRLNLAHFGGIWDYVCDPKCDLSCAWTDKMDKDWPDKIAKLVDKYDNLFVDVGDFSGVLMRWNSETCMTKEILTKLTDLVGSHQKLRSRIMYGSDWMLLDGEPQNERYYQAMQDKFSPVVGPGNIDKFLGQNAGTFLGLRSGQRTRQRIDDFYRRNQQQPPDFDKYLAA